jgi:5-methylcytosine-specific restriction endonuclease McrA
MTETRQCRRCKKTLSAKSFVDVSGKANQRGYYCQDCHQERVQEWHLAALQEEKSYISKLKIVYGDYWQHYASPEDFHTSLRDERDFCPYCGTTFSDVVPEKFTQQPIHLDHMDPLERGGEHSTRNVVYCCGPCNIAKGKRSFVDWTKLLRLEFQELSQLIYREKHGHSPERFVEGCNWGRGTRDLEFTICQTEEELRKQFPKPKVDYPPSNQPLLIELDVMKVINNLSDEVKERLKR